MQSQPINLSNTATISVPPLDPQAAAKASDVSADTLLRLLVQLPAQWAHALLSVGNIWTTTPGALSYQLPGVEHMLQVTTAAAFGLLALVLLAHGLSHTFRHVEHGRVLLAVVLVVGSMSWWQVGIGLNNALCAAVDAPGLDTLIQPFLQPAAPDAALESVILTAGYVLVAVLLMGGLVARLGMLLVLMAAAPLGLLCFALQQTRWIGQLYVKLSVAVLFCQVPISIGLALSTSFGAIGGGMAGLMASMVMLFVAAQVPRMMGPVSNRAPDLDDGPQRLSLGTIVLLRRLRE
jgi:hypothetical protein